MSNKSKVKKLRLKKGDQVRVMSGKYRGAEGSILAVDPERNRVVVENVNIAKKTQRPTQDNPRGGIRDLEMPIHASNVMVLDPQTGEPTRIGSKTLDSGEKVRVARKSGAQLDEAR